MTVNNMVLVFIILILIALTPITVCSLYPHIAYSKNFPTEAPVYLRGSAIDRLKLTNQGVFVYAPPDSDVVTEVEGVALVTIGLRKSIHIPFLPFRLGTEKKTYRASCYACVKSLSKQMCEHSFEERCFKSCYTLAEISYAVHHLNYELVVIHECCIYLTLQPIFQKYFRLCTLEKVRAEGAPSDGSNPDDYCRQINQLLECKKSSEMIYPEQLIHNPIYRRFIKMKMNSVLGKQNRFHVGCF